MKITTNNYSSARRHTYKQSQADKNQSFLGQDKKHNSNAWMSKAAALAMAASFIPAPIGNENIDIKPPEIPAELVHNQSLKPFAINEIKETRNDSYAHSFNAKGAIGKKKFDINLKTIVDKDSFHYGEQEIEGKIGNERINITTQGDKIKGDYGSTEIEGVVNIDKESNTLIFKGKICEFLHDKKPHEIELRFQNGRLESINGKMTNDLKYINSNDDFVNRTKILDILPFILMGAALGSVLALNMGLSLCSDDDDEDSSNPLLPIGIALTTMLNPMLGIGLAIGAVNSGNFKKHKKKETEED